MATKATNVKVLNAIRDAASENYRDNVPVATESNLQDVGNPILQYSSIRNEFLELLVNKIAMPIVNARRFRNPLASFQIEGSPLTTDEEEIGVNPAKGEDYDRQSTDLLSQTPPDVKAAYHRMNRQKRYTVTVEFAVMRGAFMSWEGFNRLEDQIVESLYNGNYIDEYNLSIETVAKGVFDGSMKQIVVAKPVDETTAKNFVATAQNLFFQFQNPSTEFNAWSRLGGDGAAYQSWASAEDIVLFVRSDIMTKVNVDSLASAFNIDKANFMGKIIVLPNFGSMPGAENLYAVMCSNKYLKILNKLFMTEDFRNGSNLSVNYYLHVWQIFSTSPLNNACALVGVEVPPVTLSAESQAVSVFEVPVSDLQEENVAVEGNIISGNIKYLTGENPITVKWGEGNFIALHFNAEDWTAYDSVKIGLEPSQGTGMVEIKDDPDHNGIFKIANKDTQKIKLVATKSGVSNTTYYSLTGLTLASS